MSGSMFDIKAAPVCDIATCGQPVFGKPSPDNMWCPGHRDEDIVVTFTISRQEAAQLREMLSPMTIAFNLYLQLEEEVAVPRTVEV